MTTISSTTFTLLAWSGGSQFNIVGADGNYVYSGSGNNSEPVGCANASLSGAYTFTGSGFTLSGTTQNGSQDEAGVLQFDGQGKVTAAYKDTEGGPTPVSLTASGTYTAAYSCLASATLADSSGNSQTLNFVIGGLHGETLDMLGASSQFVRTGTAHSAFTNPSQSIGNLASYVYSATPPGSLFVLFGQNLATRSAQEGSVPLPTQLANTTVTVNGEQVPLFFVDQNQIDAQMPWDIPGNSVATVIVTNGTSVSNAAAIYIPATGTPGIAAASNRAALTNANGSFNTPESPAAVGEEVAVYFTGGGPVQNQSTLISGAVSPAALAITGNCAMTEGGVPATVKYIGLTPGSIGLYQANFIVPQLAKGTYPVVIMIEGFSSNNPVMNVSN